MTKLSSFPFAEAKSKQTEPTKEPTQQATTTHKADLTFLRTTLLLTLLFALVSITWGQSVTRNAGAGANNNNIGTINWTNPGNILSIDNSYATVTLNSKTSSRYLYGSNYGFTIPSNAIISGIEVTIGIYATGSGSNRAKYNNIRLVKGGTIVGDNKATEITIPNSKTDVKFGSSTDLWSTTWTPDDINNSNFGLVFSALRDINQNTTVYVDYMSISVTYTTITSFSPTNACSGSGQSVTITGTNFTGATAVTFHDNTPAASYTVNSSTQITATLPAAAQTGPIKVTTAGGTVTSTNDFTVYQMVTPSFTQVDPICSGGTLAALPEISNNEITGTWSPVLDNTKTTTYTFTPTAGQCATTITMEIVVNANTWLGNSTDWADASNWCGGIPTSSTDVLIPSGLSNFPVISSSTTAECKNLILELNASLTIASDASATGSLKINGSATINGTVNVKRWIPSGDDWHMISSPLTGNKMGNPGFASLNNLEVDNITSPTDYDLAPYDEELDTWSGYIGYNNGTSTFATAKGYAMRRFEDTPAGAVTFSGTGINAGDILNVPVQKKKYGWNALGNPYTTALAIKGSGTASFLDHNKSKLDQNFGGVYIWDYSTNDYVVITQTPFSATPPGGESQLSQSNIAVGQGFIVKAENNGTVDFLTTMQVAAPTTLFKSAEIEWPVARLNVVAGDMQNNTIVAFNTEMTNGLDPTYDVGKFKGNPNLALYTKLVDGSSNVDFAVQALPDVTTEEILIPVGLDFPAGGEISFAVDLSSGFSADTKVYLEDTHNQTLTQLNLEDAIYSTTVAQGTAGSGRFNLVFEKYSATGIVNPAAENKFKVYNSNNTVYINGPANAETSFALYSIDGKIWTSRRAENMNQNSIDASAFPAGIYLLRINHKGFRQTEKLVIMK